MFCSLCKNNTEEESEKHLLKCIKILEGIDNPSEIRNAIYENIFSDILEDQIQITKIFAKVVKYRRTLQTKLDSNP